MNSRFAIGTVQFGQVYGVANQVGQVGRDEATAILERAWNSGIDTLDTAIVYGESEKRLGEIGVNSWRVITKLPVKPKKCIDVEKWVKEQFSARWVGSGYPNSSDCCCIAHNNFLVLMGKQFIDRCLACGSKTKLRKLEYLFMTQLS